MLTPAATPGDPVNPQGLGMLFVTANWSWTDGSLVPNRPGRGTAWLRDVHRAVLRAGFGRDGRYRPVESVDIVFAGDTFDGLASRRWTGRLRPWHGGPQATAVQEQVLAAAARRARRLLAGLARWAREGMALPTADPRGRPLLRAETRAHVRVTLLSGDRDRWLAVAADIAARHHCHVGHVWADGGSVIRHGDEFDPCWCGVEASAMGPVGIAADALSANALSADAWSANWPGATRPPLLGESVVVDLVSRFAASTLDHGLAIPAVSHLTGRLLSAAPLAIPATLADWFGARRGGTALTVARRQRIESEWRRAVAAWHREARRVPPACGIEACPVDWLAAWFERPGTAPAPADVAARFAPRPPRLGRSLVRLVLGHIGTVNNAGAELMMDGVVGLGHEPSLGHEPQTVVREGRSWRRLAVAAPATAMLQTAVSPFATIPAEGAVALSVPPSAAPSAARSAAHSSIDADTDTNAAA